ncbi:MAG: CapA family protein [Clostridia bacterium]|nr:CapA family protein [Clostridia bacterium]
MRRIFVIALCAVLLFTSCEFTLVKQSGTTDSQIQTEESRPLESATEEVANQTRFSATDTPIKPIELVEPPTLYSLSFVAAGDNMAYYGNVRDAAKNAEGTDAKYDFKPSYTTIKPFVEAHDLAFINQETLMCGEGYDLSYYPRFNSPKELGDAVVDAGFDIIGMANNHMLDKGESGLKATLDYWETKPVTLIGAYRNSEQFEDITVIEKNGISIALLAFTEHTNGLKLGKNSEMYIPYIDADVLARKVKEAETLADITIVSMHWGDEFTFKVNPSLQTDFAKIICENGGDVIIGHHPHTIQPIEWIESDTNKTLCVYSLGNFMSEMEKDTRILGGMVSFDIEKLGEKGKAEVKNVLFTPTVFDFTTKFYNNHIYFLEDYTDEQARAHGIRYYGNSTTLDKLYGYVKDNIDAEFLPDFLKTE